MRSSPRANEVPSQISLSFSSPRGQKLGDLALAIVLLPPFFVGMAVLLLIPAALGHLLLRLDHSAWRVTFPIVIALAVFLGAFSVARRLGWTIRLDKDHAQLGLRGIGPRLPYPKVQFLRVGELEELAGRKPWRSLPLVIHLAWLRRYRIWLDRADAERCFDALRHRCKNAAAVNLLRYEPQDYLPVNAAATVPATRRLRRYWATAGVACLVLGNAAYLALSVKGLDFSSLQDAELSLRILSFALAAPTFTALGWFGIRRAWSHHRAIKRRG